jgi:hypothetical protein
VAFKVRDADAKELIEWTLACQANDPQSQGLISADHGTVFKPLPGTGPLDSKKREWVCSGMKSENAWRSEKGGFFTFWDDFWG